MDQVILSLPIVGGSSSRLISMHRRDSKQEITYQPPTFPARSGIPLILAFARSTFHLVLKQGRSRQLKALQCCKLRDK